jgi:hypothetical protein
MILPLVSHEKHATRSFSIRLESLSPWMRYSGLVILVAIITMLGFTCIKMKNQLTTKGAPLDASFCDLVKNPDYYNSQTVRVRSVLMGYHELALYNPACDSQVRYIRADLDRKNRQELVNSVVALQDEMPRGNFWVDVVVVGRFEKIPEADCNNVSRKAEIPDRSYVNYCYRIEVSSMEQVQNVPATVAWPQ